MSHNLRTTTLLAAALAFGIATFAMPASAANSQQAKMTSCNQEATSKGLKGDDRKTFMKSCLSAAPASSSKNSQQEKMKTCNADAKAKSLKGADRKQFMSTCLKGSG